MRQSLKLRYPFHWGLSYPPQNPRLQMVIFTPWSQSFSLLFSILSSQESSYDQQLVLNLTIRHIRFYKGQVVSGKTAWKVTLSLNRNSFFLLRVQIIITAVPWKTCIFIEGGASVTLPTRNNNLSKNIFFYDYSTKMIRSNLFDTKGTQLFLYFIWCTQNYFPLIMNKEKCDNEDKLKFYGKNTK